MKENVIKELKTLYQSEYFRKLADSMGLVERSAF